MELKKINIWSFVKIVVILGLVFGLIWGIISSVSLAMSAKKLVAQSLDPATQAYIQNYLDQTGATSIEELAASLNSTSKVLWIFITIISTIASLIGSIILALVYNFSAKHLGGIKIELEK